MTKSSAETALAPVPARGVDLDVVALSLLRPDTDTTTARTFKEIADGLGDRAALARAGVPAALLDAVAARLGLAAARVENARAAAERAAAAARVAGLGWIGAADPAYPDRLWQIVDPPPALWIRGRPGALAAPAVAIVGARDATPGGLRVARQLASELASAGLGVISGLARGIDGAAHEGALAAGGVSVAVLGCGADIVYPRGHAALAAAMAERGAVISECAPGALPLPFRFPLRNRIISGLARAVVVIEAGEKSGSLITARAALEQGRDVLAVPGNVLSGRSKGGHALIKDGARLVETVGDVLEEIGWVVRPASQENKSFIISNLELIMAVGEEYTIDDLASRSGRRAADLLAELARLELEGRVTRTGGGHFAKT